MVPGVSQLAVTGWVPGVLWAGWAYVSGERRLGGLGPGLSPQAPADLGRWLPSVLSQGSVT